MRKFWEQTIRLTFFGKDERGHTRNPGTLAVNSLLKLKIREHILSRRIWDHAHRVWRLISSGSINSILARTFQRCSCKLTYNDDKKLPPYYQVLLAQAYYLQIHFIQVLWPLFSTSTMKEKSTNSAQMWLFLKKKNTIAR